MGAWTYRPAIVATLIGLGSWCATRAGEPPSEAVHVTIDEANGADDSTGVLAREASFLQPGVAADRPLQPAAPRSATWPGFPGAGPILAGPLSPDRAARAASPGSDVVFGLESDLRVASDTGSLLGKSPFSTGLGVQRRTPIVTDTRIRGRNVGQQLASGSYWFPARQDLDTALSKFDSRIVQDVIVIKGPYSALYGPGFSFYDVELLGSPRYQDGPEVHGSTGVDYQSNGQQFHGRQNLWGGSSDWGFQAAYNHRTGNDYETGNGTSMPASYNSRDVYLALGFDLSPDSHLEFSYLRLDQTGVEFPGQLFDMDFLVTDGFEVSYVLDNQCSFDRLAAQAWYNRTRFHGNAQRAGKRRQIPELDDPAVLDHYVGLTDADAMSTGYRLAATWGQPGSGQFTAGTDLRYLEQELNEFDISPALNTSLGQHNFNFPIPRSHLSNPGLFLQEQLPLTDRFAVTAGARVDWVSTNAARYVADTDVYAEGTPTDLEAFLGGDFDQAFCLWSAFVTGEFQIDEHWATEAGFGYGMRPPTLTELYAVGTALAILQQGLTFVVGDPNLEPERLWQIDAGVKGDWGPFRARLHGFYAWFHNYITYETIGYTPGFRFVKFINTDGATLAGGEAQGEYDCASRLTSFVTLSYVEGRDHSRSGRGVLSPPDFPDFGNAEPLPGIAPLECRLGLRLHDPGEKPRWTVEPSARLVAPQNRVASSLLEQPTPGFATFDLRGYWQATDSLLLIAGVENLTDVQYREHLDLRTGLGV